MTDKVEATLGSAGYTVRRVKQSRKLADAVTGTGTQTEHALQSGKVSVAASGTTTAGAGAATIAVEVSNDMVTWVVAGTITLVLATTITTTTNTDGFVIAADWAYIRANITAISGTGAAVTVTI